MKCIALFRASRTATVAIYTDAPRSLTAKEYKNIVRMVEFDLETAEADEKAEALRTFPAGSLEAMCRALRDAMGDEEGDWQSYAHAAASALVNMPASAIEAASAAKTTQIGLAEGESAVPHEDAGDAQPSSPSPPRTLKQ